MNDPAIEYVRESNRIEGIGREPKAEEVAELRHFMTLRELAIPDLVRFVGVYQPDAVLRDRPGLNVRVGDHIAPAGGPDIVSVLRILLDYANLGEAPYDLHRRYENLHPFTDGNGRSGRAVWLWQMTRQGRGAPLGFLHHWYYQSLGAGR